MRRSHSGTVIATVAVAAFVTKAAAQTPNAILTYSTAELLEAQRVALAQLAPEPLVDSTGASRVTVCVSVNRGGQEFAADSVTLAALEMPGRRALIAKHCPRTYVMAMYNTDRAPRGYIDPYYMSVTHISAPNDTRLVMMIDVTQDIRTTSYRCTVTRPKSSWHSECELYATSAGQ